MKINAMINIKRIVNKETDQNCYLVYDREKNGIIIDPGNKLNVILENIKNEGVKVFYIFLTHCHYDHIECLEELRNELGAKVVSSFECNKNIQKSNINLSGVFSDVIEASCADIILNDNDVLKIGDMSVKIILTPGHTNGSACFLIENDLFSGDTLFLNSVGRWDFPTGDGLELKNSIKNKIYTLDDEIIVHPGHGNDTKIYYEKRYNMYVKE